ncbi:MAG: imidazole glycerol phosphate synthase subunit HisH [Vampirovibrionales bacterium]|nr:imidazole glycerol phosphate synthase subunit HisH [Vampirovibrionales bacterium]
MSSPPQIELIDYGGGNIASVMRALERLSVSYVKVGPDLLPSGRRPLILPGVGAFGATMAGLRRGGLHSRLVELLGRGVPYLGICVGLQILFEKSAESEGTPGLGILCGEVARLTHRKIPQIGWNRLRAVNDPDAPEGEAYFVNSFAARPADPGITLYESDYGGPFCAAIQRQNVTGFQFHPEKSGPFGHELLRRWLDAV